MGETNEDLRKKIAAAEAKLAEETKARETAEAKLAEEIKARKTAESKLAKEAKARKTAEENAASVVNIFHDNRIHEVQPNPDRISPIGTNIDAGNRAVRERELQQGKR